MNRALKVGLLLSILALMAPVVCGQTTSNLTGTVTTDGKPLPGATVTVSSGALQGSRSVVTGPNGDYDFPGLPPGTYGVTFQLEGMQTLYRRALLKLAETSRSDADLKVSAVAESITVTAMSPSVIETPQVSTNFMAQQIEDLPVGRAITDRVLLAPGVTSSGPNNQIVIHGAQSFDNLYLVNGVVVNENVRGQPQAAVIEDAIQETTILTGGVSAEYGRFTGGVVSTITKSGGNEFSGSLRDNLTNDNWTHKTAFSGESDHIDRINPIYEGTLGGRIVRDRLWFFLAGRGADSSTSSTTVGLNLPFTTTSDQKRYEAKLTGDVTGSQTLVGSYLEVQDNQTGTKFGNIVDTASLRDVGNPIKLYSLHYGGVVGRNLLLEGQWSRKDFSIVGGGATARDEVNGTMVRDIVTGWRGWSPTFCGVCPPKQRNNKDWLGKASYFLSTATGGSHSIATGYDEFHQLRNEDNFQSGSDFRLFGDFTFSAGQLFLHLDPTKVDGVSRSFWEWDPLLGLSQTSDFATKSAFINDKWDFSNHWTFNVGGRFDRNTGHNQTGVDTVDDSRFSPRLGIIFDAKGNGKHRISLNYGRYVTKIDQGPADSTSTGGRYATYLFQYGGPEINAPGTPASQLVPTAEVIKQAFDWFHANGFTDNQNLIFSVSVPGLTEKINGSLESPFMDETTLGYGMQFGDAGFARADLIHRSWGDFYVTRRDLSTGQAALPSGANADVGFIENSSAGLSRKYDAAQVQAQSRILGHFTVGGNYTYSRLRGNVEGEEFNNATVTVGAIGSLGANIFQSPEYPEYTGFAANNPVGYLAEDMRHRANAWLSLDTPVPYGALSLSVLQRYHSGTPYSALGILNDRAFVTNPGYALPPSRVAYFFGGRGAFRTDSIFETSLNANYSLPLRGKWTAFFKADVINVFNRQGIESSDSAAGPVIDRTVIVTGSNLKPFNPFTDKPVLGTNYLLSPSFGQPTSKDAYQLPRTYRVAVGLRY
jgi:hypothetical protein